MTTIPVSCARAARTSSTTPGRWRSSAAELKLDTATISAALLHDVVEDTQAELDHVRELFGADVALLVDGVTKLTRISFASREQAQVENYRKMIVAMAQDLRVVLIKLADRLHNMRTIAALGKQKQVQTAKETLEIYAPLAHRLGIHTIKWELEDLRLPDAASRAASPRSRRWSTRAATSASGSPSRPARSCRASWTTPASTADIAGRAEALYSIYTKMAQGGKEFNEIYDLTAIRVLVDRLKDCYGAIGIIHSLWKPMPGRFKDYIAMPKVNMYQSLHTTVIGPQGKPLEIQVRTQEMHQTAEYGIAAHWLYKEKARPRPATPVSAWLRAADGVAEGRRAIPSEFMETLRVDLFSDEVYVFTPKGDVKSLPAGATPLDFAYAVHTDVGHRCVGAKVNGRIVPLHYTLKSGDFVEMLTVQAGARAVARLAEPGQDVARPGQDPPVVPPQAPGGPRAEGSRLAAAGAEVARAAAPEGDGSPLLAGIIRDMGFKKAEDFYVAIGAGKIQVGQVVSKLLRPAEDRRGSVARDEQVVPTRRPPKRPTASADSASWSRARPAPACWCGWPSAARRCRATTSAATSRWAAASRSIARTAPTCAR